MRQAFSGPVGTLKSGCPGTQQCSWELLALLTPVGLSGLGIGPGPKGAHRVVEALSVSRNEGDGVPASSVPGDPHQREPEPGHVRTVQCECARCLAQLSSLPAFPRMWAVNSFQNTRNMGESAAKGVEQKLEKTAFARVGNRKKKKVKKKKKDTPVL